MRPGCRPARTGDRLMRASDGLTRASDRPMRAGDRLMRTGGRTRDRREAALGRAGEPRSAVCGPHLAQRGRETLAVDPREARTGPVRRSRLGRSRASRRCRAATTRSQAPGRTGPGRAVGRCLVGRPCSGRRRPIILAAVGPPVRVRRLSAPIPARANVSGPRSRPPPEVRATVARPRRGGLAPEVRAAVARPPRSRLPPELGASVARPPRSGRRAGSFVGAARRPGCRLLSGVRPVGAPRTGTGAEVIGRALGLPLG
jgi:hypothetical protein